MVNNTYTDKFVDNFNEKFNKSCLKDVHCIIKCVTKSLRLVYGTSIIVIYPCCQPEIWQVQQPTHIHIPRQSWGALQGCYKTWPSCMTPCFQPVTCFSFTRFSVCCHFMLFAICWLHIRCVWFYSCSNVIGISLVCFSFSNRTKYIV